MTNAEKAKERARQVFPCPNEDEQRRITELAYNDACEWKDQQYSEIIKEECNTSYESGIAEGERKAEARFKEYLMMKRKKLKNEHAGILLATAQVGKICCIDEIMEEFFKEEKK